jgi:hypothetical protein
VPDPVLSLDIGADDDVEPDDTARARPFADSAAQDPEATENRAGRFGRGPAGDDADEGS